MSANNNQCHCCFCYEPIDLSVDGLVLDVHRPEHEPSQTLAEHATCLAARLHERVPFDALAFGD